MAEADEAEDKDPVKSIAGQIANLSTGHRAQLRRLFLVGPHSIRADGVVAGLLHRAGVRAEIGSAEAAAWRLIAHVAATLSGTAAEYPHAAGKRVGTALHAAGYSENRLLRLTAARGPALQDQIIRAARVLAQAGQRPVNLWTLLDLAGPWADRAEAARLRIAQDYYAADARA
jgi:CRISPR type I-E-associated protein CasB/Cse2